MEAFDKKKDLSLTYEFKVFEILRQWVSGIKEYEFKYSTFPECIRAYIGEEEWIKEHERLLNNSNSHEAYLKCFFAKYDAFWVLKFVHFYRDNYCSNTNLLNNAICFYAKWGLLRKKNK